MFALYLVFCDVQHVQSLVLGQNVMFRKFNVWTQIYAIQGLTIDIEYFFTFSSTLCTQQTCLESYHQIQPISLDLGVAPLFIFVNSLLLWAKKTCFEVLENVSKFSAFKSHIKIKRTFTRKAWEFEVK